MKTETANMLEEAAKIKGRKLTKTETIVLVFFTQTQELLTGEDLFMGLYNEGQPVGYPTIYVTLRRLTALGLLKKQQLPNSNKVGYVLEQT
ncbi:hypothetical protein GCM10023231_41400 [Olivibacter ginsenosidimutans]|uniref:PadR family transcriptional regulator n=1 Tax=Olivibacter ginsenosidimutans TaxID=1176537 RepID=A0ABP9CBE4_9SPHI